MTDELSQTRFPTGNSKSSSSSAQASPPAQSPSARLEQGAAERVRLIGEKKEGIHEVLEVAEGRFRTDFVSEGDHVFVFGREVNDFRSVDYEAISMLNVSATQQIKKEKDAEVKALQEENSALRARVAALESQAKRLAELEAKDQSRDAKLAAIEKLLAAPAQAAVRTVSLNTAAAQ